MREPCSSGHASRPFGASGKAVRTRHDKARSGELCRQPWSILKENIVIASERREQRQGRTANRAGITPDRAFHHHSVGKALPVHAGPIFVCALDQATAHVERKGPVDDDGFKVDHGQQCGDGLRQDLGCRSNPRIKRLLEVRPISGESQISGPRRPAAITRRSN